MSARRARLRRTLLTIALASLALVAPSTADAAPGIISTSPKNLNFGRVAFGGAVDKSLLVTNTSDVTWELTSSLGPPFSVVANSCTVAGGVAPGSTCVMSIRFFYSIITVPGRHVDTLTLTPVNCVPCGASRTITLRATALAT